MGWYLNEDISFCQLDAKLFFLDIQRDRYFQLPNKLERNFLRYLEAPDDADVSELVRCNLLTQTSTGRAWDSTRSHIIPPDQSLLETTCFSGHISANVVEDVFFIVCMMRWRLRAWRLKSILKNVIEYRNARSSWAAGDELEIRQRLVEAATAFNHVRPYVPVETCCLVDSLSLIRFLAKRGLHAHLIMGVACDPFSAHAWVQRGSLVLNETVGTAEAHVPIRVI